ncbi:MAG: type II secretion system ATPase GspE [Pseudomonadota bacterium]|nr:type II secretion system ATPase GspE [Pseudomonadota bacterium]
MVAAPDENLTKKKDPEKKQFSFSFAKKHGVLIKESNDIKAEVIYRDDASILSLSEAKRYLDKPIEYIKVSKNLFSEELQIAFETTQSKNVIDGLEEETDLIKVAQEIPEPSDILESDDQAPIIKLINAILTEAVKRNASDIHVETYENKLSVRLRIDGVLEEILNSKQAISPLIISRIKVMAKLDIAEKRLPQDGRISLLVAGRPVDVRVSTIPSGHGERIVLRLLDKQTGRLLLSNLGMSNEIQKITNSIINRPHGIILVTGPTGSGKTTTLYALLQEINDSKKNILTVEDPIEYYIDGIGQTQVNNKVEMTFARGLRAILRQDPDVVMVGEIRDLETAQIAVQASLTGHLVLSTLHTNTAIGAITRLRDMGIEPFLLASSLIGIISQRLVRVLNNNKELFKPNEYEKKLLKLDKNSLKEVYKESSEGSGYQGRTGIYEVVNIDKEMKNMIHDEASEQKLERRARKNTPSLKDDGIRKVLDGSTSIEEFLRVNRKD